ncbi:aminotransferase class V-fold PLP-dependent enzyme [Desulfovibrio inopinatus]|uniref:aminotransferase class V-fold PLP-dependent enzyme n=1 Tax=Desulfovibrio inopinatus TaxID=102109 RepID=UPI000422C19C|nr:aminotransferase class V-fold PLP-dependent enzyme [Desulfovibrio inopinatus]
MIYLDNAATSYPKNEPALRRAMERYLALGASPGRGGYDRAVEAEELVSSIRQNIATFCHAPTGSHTCFAANATDALNTLIQGMADGTSHIVSTRLEHNSVLRPLRHMQYNDLLEVDILDFDDRGFVSVESIEAALRPHTKAVIITHASNVLGTVQPLIKIGAMLHRHGVALCVDASQSVGHLPIDMQAAHIDALVFTGHKGPAGPTGIGALVLDPCLDVKPSRFGGTGVDSHNPFQPTEYPARLESGTQNMLGIIALEECLRDLSIHTQSIRLKEEMRLLKRLFGALVKLPGVRVYGGHDMEKQVPLLSCTVNDMKAADVGAVLDGDFDIAVRTGLHCAPLVHERLGTAPYGTVRFSLGSHTTDADIDAAIEAMQEIAQSCGSS